MSARSILKSPRRSFLFTPGDSLRKISKSAEVGADCVILDLEDAVVLSQKEDARRNVVTALASLDFGRTERLVRVNPVDTVLFRDDLSAIVNADLDGIVLPKVESAQQIERADQIITAKEKEIDRRVGSIRLFVLIETALGIMNIKGISQASGRIDGLIFGAEDLAADLGTNRTPAGQEILFGRSTVVFSAAAYNLTAVDTVYLQIDDPAGLEEDTSLAKQLGYSGKLAIHPRQIEALNRIFSPSEDEIIKAKSLIKAYESHVAAGSGVFTQDGHMVDMPHIRAAQHLLEKARLCRLMDA